MFFLTFLVVDLSFVREKKTLSNRKWTRRQLSWSGTPLANSTKWQVAATQPCSCSRSRSAPPSTSPSSRCSGAPSRKKRTSQLWLQQPPQSSHSCWDAPWPSTTWPQRTNTKHNLKYPTDKVEIFDIIISFILNRV